MIIIIPNILISAGKQCLRAKELKTKQGKGNMGDWWMSEGIKERTERPMQDWTKDFLKDMRTVCCRRAVKSEHPTDDWKDSKCLLSVYLGCHATQTLIWNLLRRIDFLHKIHKLKPEFSCFVADRHTHTSDESFTRLRSYNKKSHRFRLYSGLQKGE